MDKVYSLKSGRNIILFALLLLAAISWIILIWQSQMTSSKMMNLTMGMSPLLFLLIWVVMMIAMMFPTAAPMILLFNKIHSQKRHNNQTFVPTWIFISAYLLIWTLFGVLAYIVAVIMQNLTNQSVFLSSNATRIGGVIIILAGVYQFSPLKKVCLSKCRTPLGFIMNSWRDGYLGSFIMGLKHGMYCLGCCWLLFVILFPLGIMNVTVMVLLTLLIFAEKSLPIGQKISRLAAFALILYGVFIFFHTQSASTTM